MLISICGTPGVGKTILSKRLEEMGWNRMDLRDMIIENGWGSEFEGEGGELIIDKEVLMNGLSTLKIEKNTVIDGHLSYLAPSDVTLVLRSDPRVIRDRLKKRGYPLAKVDENVEAEMVSVILVEAVELEEERYRGKEWTSMEPGCGTVFEIDATGLSPDQVMEKTLNIIDHYRQKRLNELVSYRPGKVDWLEVMAEWC